MTFPANLERLLKEAKEPSIKGELINFNAVIAKQKLALLLHNHADAILGLVRAAEDMLSGWRYIRETHGDLSGVGWDRAEDKVREALAKLNGAEK